MLAVLPMFSTQMIPVQLRIALGALVALLVTPMLPTVPADGISIWLLVKLIFMEVSIGLLLGFAIGAINAAAYGIYLNRYADRPDPGRILGLIVAAETVPYVIVPLSAAVWQASADAALIPVLFAIGAVLAIGASVLTLTRVGR